MNKDNLKSCRVGWHMGCLEPALTSVLAGVWCAHPAQRRNGRDYKLFFAQDPFSLGAERGNNSRHQRRLQDLRSRSDLSKPVTCSLVASKKSANGWLKHRPNLSRPVTCSSVAPGEPANGWLKHNQVDMADGASRQLLIRKVG
jgi:hypothetical protein